MKEIMIKWWPQHSPRNAEANVSRWNPTSIIAARGIIEREQLRHRSVKNSFEIYIGGELSFQSAMIQHY